MKIKGFFFFACFCTCFVPVLAYGQATVVQSPVPKFHSFLPGGTPNASGCVYTFTSGTSTPLATYTDFTGNFTNPNPVQLDANGEAQIWITSAIYRFQVWSFGSGALGSNCGGGSLLYQIDGIKDTGLSAAITSLGQVITINTPTNQPQISTVNPAGTGQIYNIPDPGTGGNFVINPGGNSSTGNVLDCTLSGITCKRTASLYFRGAQCNGATPALGWDTPNINAPLPSPLCVNGTNVTKGVMGMGAAYTHVQQNTGTSNAAGTITTTYPAATVGGAGDMLVLSVAFNGTTTISGCTDGTNAYTQAKHIALGALSLDIWVFHSPTTKPAGTTLTCTFGAAATGAIKWHEYLSANTTSTDVTASNSNGGSTSATTGTTATLAQAPELVFSAVGNINNATEVATTTGYVDHTFTPSNAIAVVDDAGIVAQSLTGQSTSFTLGSSQPWVAAIATFKAANSGSFANGGPVAEQTFSLPSFFNPAAAINTAIKWTLGATPIGTATTRLAAVVSCVADGVTDDPAFPSATFANISILSSGTNIPTTTPINGLTSTGCAANSAMHLAVFRDRYNTGDTYEGFIQIMGVQLTMGITQ